MDETIKKNMKEKFIASNFDEVDMAMDTDRRFDEVLEAADAGEGDLVDYIIRDMKESGMVNTTYTEEEVIEYNPEDLDVRDIADETADEYSSYVSEEDYTDDDGEIIDSIMGNDAIDYNE